MGLSIKQVSEKYDIPQDTLRYYEKVGIIPPVTRSASGQRSYEKEDLNWVENAKCMRQAGLSVEFLVKYLQLYQQGDETFEKRLELLKIQQTLLLEQQKKLEETLQRLAYKISRYEIAVKNGALTWRSEEECMCSSGNK